MRLRDFFYTIFFLLLTTNLHAEPKQIGNFRHGIILRKKLNIGKSIPVAQNYVGSSGVGGELPFEYLSDVPSGIMRIVEWKYDRSFFVFFRSPSEDGEKPLSFLIDYDRKTIEEKPVMSRAELFYEKTNRSEDGQSFSSYWDIPFSKITKFDEGVGHLFSSDWKATKIIPQLLARGRELRKFEGHAVINNSSYRNIWAAGPEGRVSSSSRTKDKFALAGIFLGTLALDTMVFHKGDRALISAATELTFAVVAGGAATIIAKPVNRRKFLFYSMLGASLAASCLSYLLKLQP